MRKRNFLLLLVLFCNTIILAQKPASLLNEWGEKSPIQKIYLQLDRENYVAGQTAFFAAYLSTDFLPDTANTTIYVELYNADKLISKSVFPVLLGTASGSFSLPDTLSTGNYYIRAFSAGMLAQSSDYFFKRKVFVNGSTSKQIEVSVDTISLVFFPEGGNIVSNLEATVAFKATDKNGLPVNIIATLFNDKNEELATLTCLHEGMGLFDLEPKASEKYYVKIKADVNNKKYYLPETVDKGITLSIGTQNEESTFEIKQKLIDTAFVAAYMIGQMQHHVVFKKDFSKQKDIVKGVIATKNLPSGIMQLTVFNKYDMPLAERILFVNNKEYLLSTDVITDTLNFSSGGRNRLFIDIKDTVQGQISVGITDPEYDLSKVRENNIISSLLLTSDLKGFINNAAWYLSSTEDSVKNSLDLLMMVNGWRRFKWLELNKVPKKANVSNAYITLKGRATYEGISTIFSNKLMVLLINSMLSKNKRSTNFVQTDKDGNFKVDSLILFGKNKLMFMDTRGKKNSSINITLDTDTLFAGVILPAKNYFPRNYAYPKISPKLKLEYDDVESTKKLMLKEVIVIGKTKTALEKVEEKYTSGLFAANAIKTIDLVNSDDASTYPNILDYLELRVPGLKVIAQGFDYKLLYRQNGSISSSGSSSMTVFLDEVETDASIVASIPGSQIALVKVFSTFVGGFGNSQGGAISIYTKKFDDNSNAVSPSIKIYNGYTITKEFYAPNYKTNNRGLENDNRITIDWRPQIFVNSINPKIPVSFYNNNRTKSFKVVVEGMTNTGKLIWLEKLVN
jgi:hypothetical protein